MNLCPSAHRRAVQEQICDYYIITMLLVFPLFPGFSGYENITISKYVFFLAATGLWLAALIFTLLRGKASLPRPGAAGIAAVIYLLVCVLSWLCSPDKAVSFLGAGRYDGLLTILACVLIFLGVSAWARPSLRHARAFALAISVSAIIALLQLGGGNPLGLYPDGLTYYDGGFSYSGAFLGTVGNTNILDAILCLALPLFCGLYLCGKGAYFLLPVLLSVPVLMKAGGDGAKLALFLSVPALLPLLLTEIPRIRRVLRLGAYLLLAAAAAGFWQPQPGYPFAFAFSETAGWLCAAAPVLLALSLLPCPTRFQPAPRTLRRFFALLSVVILLTGAVFVFLAPENSGTLFELQQTIAGNADDSFGSSRIRIWRRCLALVQEHPLLGGGPGTLALRLEIEFSRFVPETGITLTSYADNAHNVYLAGLTDTGFLGLAAMLAVFGLSALEALRRAKDGLVAALGLGAMCCAVHEFFGLGLFISAPLLWLVLGLLCSCQYHSDHTRRTNHEE